MSWRDAISVPVPKQGCSNGGAYFVGSVLHRIRCQMGIALGGGRMMVPEHFADDR